MSEWHTDMNAAPRGKTIQAQRLVTDKNSATGKSLKTVDEYQRDDVILASKCGKVIKSYWIPDENRFAGFQPGEEIDAWFPWPEHPFKAAPGDAAVTLGNDLRKPVAAEQGQIIREGDAPRETDRASGDASGPDTDQPEKATKSGVGPLPGAAGADGTHKPAEDERSVEAVGGAALVLNSFMLDDAGGGA